MTIRFLQTSESALPDSPFQAGQVITVPRLTREMAAALERGTAEVVRTEDVAAVEVSERAVTPRGRKRVA